MIENSGFKISNMKMTKLTQNEALELMGEQGQSNNYVKEMVANMLSDVSIGIEVLKDSGINDLQ